MLQVSTCPGLEEKSYVKFVSQPFFEGAWCSIATDIAGNKCRKVRLSPHLEHAATIYAFRGEGEDDAVRER